MKYAIYHNPTTGKAGAVSSESRDLLQAYLESLPGNFFGCVAGSPDEIIFAGPVLVKIYNAIAADNVTITPINKFQDLSVAKRRVFELATKVATRLKETTAPERNQKRVEAYDPPARPAKKVRVPRSEAVKKIKSPGHPAGLRKVCDDYPLSAVITVLVDKNPKRPGSVSETRFACYKTGETVEQYLRAGGRGLDVKWDVDHGFISVQVK